MARDLKTLLLSESLSSNGSPNSSPRNSRGGLKTHNRDKKNPYADRGLDKFSALLTDLEEKRKKIYSQTDPQNIVMVRFAYKNADECVPVVVKQKDKIEENHVTDSEAKPVQPSPSEKDTRRPTQNQKQADRKTYERARNLRRWSRPAYYISAVVILILLLLSMFGRSVTIMCTCVLWYLVPVLKQSSSKSRSPTKRKEYARTLAENKPGSDGPSTPQKNSYSSSPPKVRGLRKSW